MTLKLDYEWMIKKSVNDDESENEIIHLYACPSFMEFSRGYSMIDIYYITWLSFFLLTHHLMIITSLVYSPNLWNSGLFFIIIPFIDNFLAVYLLLRNIYVCSITIYNVPIITKTCNKKTGLITKQNKTS